ncbi:ATP-binding protein [Streptosporangium sp. NPDC051022]|uniref:ATP-binding protein n=1 Tax=Streptosporangium sp. NPDC051022 TaxID=3155752 RepID=UPI0034134A75
MVRRLWLTALALTACVAAYVVATLLLSSSLGGDWQVTVISGVATAAALAMLVAIFSLRRRHRQALGALLQRDRYIEQREAGFQQEIERRDTQWRDHLVQRSQALDRVLRHLGEVRLPAALDGSVSPPALHDAPVDDEVAAAVERLVDEVARAGREGRERQESLRLAVVALARRVQTSAHRIQETASLMAGRHPGNADVLESSMNVDHAAAQQGRHAQSLAVLCGEWPGQQWPKPLALVDVVRAGSARIVAYKRVEVSGDPDTAAAAQVVEPLIHLVAELLANATQSSPPRTKVSVAVRHVQRGAVIEIDDGGVGLDEHRLEQAREVISGRRTVELGEVGEIPQTGLAVVGHYVRRYGFQADLLQSPYGGVRAVVLIPAEVVETLEPAGAFSAQQIAHESGLAVPPPSTPGSLSRDIVAGLPQRRSLRDQPRPAAASSPAPASPPPAQTPEQAGAWMTAYFNQASGAENSPSAAADAGDAPDNR